MMTTKRYDEFQLATRHKIAFQTMIFMFFIIMMNGYVKHIYGVWAEPMLEMLLMVIIPAMYFTFMSIAKNAYLSEKDDSTLFIVAMGIAVLLLLATVISNLTSGMFRLVEDGQLTSQAGTLCMLLFSSGTVIIQTIRRRLNKKILVSS